MSAHTPGPWRYQREEEREVSRAAIVRFEVYKAEGLYGHPATCEREEDARLIAAAPDLLEALTTAWHALRSYQHGNVSRDLAEEVAARAEAVIAKAEGARV